MNNKILVTGVTGYIGSKLAQELYYRGYQVHGIIRPESQLDLLTPIIEYIDLHVYKGYIESLQEIFKKVNPYIVIHLAGLFISDHKSEEVDKLVQSNIVFSTQLLEAVIQNNIKYFINTGTHWQKYLAYNSTSINLYAATKEAFEVIASYYVNSKPLSMITLQLIDTYGPFDPRGKIVNLLKKIAKNNEVLEMSEGEQELGLVHIDDVMKSFMVAIQEVVRMEQHEKKTYLVAPEKFYALREVVELFEKVSEKSLNIIWGKRPYRTREVMKIELQYPNILEGQELVSLEEGIRRILQMEKGI